MNNPFEQIKILNNDFSAKTGKKRLFFCRTFGCQMNVHDTEKIAALLLEMGYEPAQNEEEADIVVLNSCCVRENAENRLLGNLGTLKKLKETKKDLKAVVCGCMAQARLDNFRPADVVFGTHNIHMFPELLWRHFQTGKQVMDIRGQYDLEKSEVLRAERESPFKASVNIMYGCNNFCSYCIVPYVRGREISRSTRDILNEVNALAEDGVKEVLLLGQNVNSYGSGEEFPLLLEKINGISGIERIRFITSHPKDLSDRLINAVAELPKAAKHLHLPIQSGSSRILEKMNRRYTKEHFIGLCEKIKAASPDISITTDIIVGFPAETEEDFEHTLDVARRIKFNGAFTFYYPKRTGTPAAKMDGQIDAEVMAKRFKRLLDIINPAVFEINKSFERTLQTVLAEEITDDGMITGRASNNALVHFKGSGDLIGKFIDVKITEGKPFYLLGSRDL